MSLTRRIRIHEVLLHLGIEDEGGLACLRAEGLFEHDDVDACEAEELRVALMMMGELGVNAAGAHVALNLRRRLLTLEARTTEVVRLLQNVRTQEKEDSNDG